MNSQPMPTARITHPTQATLEHGDRNQIDLPYDVPDSLVPLDDSDEWSDLDDSDPSFEQDDEPWEVFVPDDDQRDPQPEPDDFWGSDEADDWDDV